VVKFRAEGGLHGVRVRCSCRRWQTGGAEGIEMDLAVVGVVAVVVAVAAVL
jgi:hypothetical protein